MDFGGIVSRFSDSSKISSILLYIIPLFSDITYYLFSYCCCPQILSLFILLLSSDIPTDMLRFLLGSHQTILCVSECVPTDMLRFLLGSHCLVAHALCNSPYGLRQAHAFAAVCSSRRKPRNCLWEYPRMLHGIESFKISHGSDYLKISKKLIGSHSKCVHKSSFCSST